MVHDDMADEARDEVTEEVTDDATLAATADVAPMTDQGESPPSTPSPQSATERAEPETPPDRAEATVRAPAALAPAAQSPWRAIRARVFGAARAKRWYLAGGGGAVMLALVVSLLLSVAASPLALMARPTRTATPTPAREHRDDQTTVDPRAAHNAVLGCAPDAPAPLPGVLLGGKYPGSAEPAPKEVALTFDDGPTPESTAAILSILERTHTTATFFVEGQWVTKYPDLLRREWGDGFAIGNHSWDHPMMAHLGQEDLAHQFGDTNDAIHRILGADACFWLYRPPYANYNPLVLQSAASYGLSTINWDDGSLDWAVPRPAPEQIAHQVLVALHPGAVILMHDGPVRHPNTEAALPLVIQELVARGYLPVTLPRLLADMHYPGVTAPGPLPPMPTVPPDLLPASSAPALATVAQVTPTG